MVYVNSDGSISANQPWPKRITSFFWGFVDFLANFVRTLTNPALNGRGAQYVTDYRRPGGGPPQPPQRRTGGFKTMSDCRAPMPGGG